MRGLEFRKLTLTYMPATFQKNVTASGTPVQLPSNDSDHNFKLTIKAKAANTGTITLGFSSADALNSGTGHFKLAAGEAIDLQLANSNEVWIDATVNGEGVEGVIA